MWVSRFRRGRSSHSTSHQSAVASSSLSSAASSSVRVSTAPLGCAPYPTCSHLWRSRDRGTSLSRIGLSRGTGVCVNSFAVRGAAELSRGGPRAGRPFAVGAMHGSHSTTPELCRPCGGPNIRRAAVGGLSGAPRSGLSVLSVAGVRLSARLPASGLWRGVRPLHRSPLLGRFCELAPGDRRLSRPFRHAHAGSVARIAVRSASFMLSAMA